MLANVVVMVAGLHVRNIGQQQRYQSNSIRHRSVLSAWRLCLEWLRRHRANAAPWPSWEMLKANLREEIRKQDLSRLIHEGDLKTKIADGILLKNQCVPPRT
ncbi:hypothetical protein QLQ86_18055 [Halomonas sp. LR5S13]|nr:hypothetical protein [Halomonas rhizosphaerae]